MSITPWTDTELKECIKAYFKMLQYENNKTPYVKSGMNQKLRKSSLQNRTKASIEYRMQNISSVLQEHSIEYLRGYKPATNVGTDVKERIWKIVCELPDFKRITMVCEENSTNLALNNISSIELYNKNKLSNKAVLVCKAAGILTLQQLHRFIINKGDFLSINLCSYQTKRELIKFYCSNKQLINIDTPIILYKKLNKRLYEYAEEALKKLKKPCHISEIYAEIKRTYKNFEYSENSIKSSITREKNKFIYFGRSSTYGLKVWEYKLKNIKGGTIRDIVEEYLEDEAEPKHISEIMKYVSKYRITSKASILQNLKLDSKPRFKFYEKGYIGLQKKELCELDI